MAELNMNDIIHAAVRRDLARMQAALSTFPAGDRERAVALQRAWNSLWDQLHHHEGEDEFVFPYVRSLGAEAIDPAVLDAMEDEHQAMAASMVEAREAVDALVGDPSREGAQLAARAVAHAAAVTDRHLVHEETAVVPIIAEHDTTPEWKAVEKQLRRGSATFTGEMFAWLEDGGRPEVQEALARTVPAPVRFVFSRVFGRRYHREVAPVWR